AKQFGVSISREALRKLLHRKGLSWTRPTYTLAKGNLDEQKQFEKQMDLIKKKLDHQGDRRCCSSVHR
ncbi:winged helix-turn-helix domain-containing protein, partial [Geobacillus stearothermophilus]|nr:winged helix-turn-helix domain-containing protein [Geobacillus stearothermophilus]